VRAGCPSTNKEGQPAVSKHCRKHNAMILSSSTTQLLMKEPFKLALQCLSVAKEPQEHFQEILPIDKQKNH